MEFALIWIGFSLAVGALSRSRGHSFLAGTFFALILSPLLAGIIVLIRKPNYAKLESQSVESGSMRKCPYCAELVKVEAIRCKHCSADLPPASPPRSIEETSWGDP